MSEDVEVRLTVNGDGYRVRVEPRKTLVDALREDCNLTGTHIGCEHGVCGACTVLVDDRAVRSCLMFAYQAEGTSIRTIEGLADADGTLHPVQAAFREAHGLQCGFCTPGFVMSIVALLDENGAPTPQEVREGLSGNLCRCTGYQTILEAVDIAAATLRATSLEATR
ncbi:MAG: (2Fe-2S)-binding protein [Acidimicrobiales bacterium]|nr:(2Fe-2S)-binding protein [Acidimicrobiales bacterium]